MYIENDAERYITNGSQQLSPNGGVFFAYTEKIYTQIHTHTHIYTCMYIYKHIYIHTYIYAYFSHISVKFYATIMQYFYGKMRH